MLTSLLATKLNLPYSRFEERMVSRPYLLSQLNNGFRSGPKLSRISASAGLGKTTLLTAWLDETSKGSHSDRKVAWYSLDTSVSDLYCFFAYMISAVQTIQPNIDATALTLLTSPQSHLIENFLTELLNEIAGLHKKLVLVVDDYHLFETQEIHQAVTFILEHLPTQLHLVILREGDPPLSLSDLRTSVRLTQLRAGDLRITLDKTLIFLNQIMELNLTVNESTALEVKAEGWIAGLKSTALSIQHRMSFLERRFLVQILLLLTAH